MSDMNRREALTLLALTPFAATVRAGSASATEPVAEIAPEKAPDKLLFFTPHEFATGSLLADLIIPRDERSGSATDAGVMEYIDFILQDAASGSAVEIRGGLAWLDAESHRRYQHDFLDLTPDQHAAILDDIAWPDRATPQMSHGVAFFSRFRDLVGSGFFSSEVGVEDLQYRGNTVVLEWTGCPPEALAKLGVRYS